MIKLTLPSRTEPQKKISNSKARFKVVCFGRQSGKTTNGIWRMARTLEGPENAIYWHVLQTYSAAEIAFKRFVNLFPYEARSLVFEKSPNQSELCVYLSGNRQIHFKSGDNFQNLRAETLHGVIIDECREQDKRVWTQVIRPMLARYKGWAEFYSTPNGYDWFFDLYEFAQRDPEWAAFQAPSTEAPWWSPEEIDSARRSMSEAEFAQEILAEFRDLAQGKAYLNFGPHNKRDHNPLAPQGATLNPYLPIHVGLDFNLTPMAWTLAQKKADHMHFFDEIFLRGSHTPEAAKVLVEKVRGHKPGIILCGDATARAGQRAAAGASDYDILCQILDANGIKWINLTPESNPMVKDRVNTVNARLKSASGDVHVTVDVNNCPNLVKDFERVVWKQGSGSAILDQTTDRELTHTSDGAGYLICQTLPIESSSSPVGVLSVVIR